MLPGDTWRHKRNMEKVENFPYLVKWHEIICILTMMILWRLVHNMHQKYFIHSC